MAGNWIKITSKNMPERKVLVTNNIDARDANGQMSHVWLADVGVYQDGKKFNAFVDLIGCQRVYNLTHFCEIPV